MFCETETINGPWNDKSLLVEFRESILTGHNIRRADHGSGPLKLCTKLNNYAQEWAELNADMEESVHRPDPYLIYGENLHRMFCKSGKVDVMANLICTDFYNEIVNYKFGVGSINDMIDVENFTQMVWYDATELGVGIARGESGFVYCVINYNPKGNIAGEFNANVFPGGTIYVPNRTRRFIAPPVNRLANYPIINKFRKLVLNQHNLQRRAHGVPFVRISDQLNEIAQKWAIRLAERDQLDYSSSTIYGENIFILFTTELNTYPDVKEMHESFLEEREKYNYDVEDVDCKSGHFTQVVWKSTTEIGVGIQKAASGNVYVVVNYNPRGNIIGEYLANVLRPIDVNRPAKKIAVSVV